MKQIFLVCGLSLLLAACTAPKPPQPTGDWVPVNPSVATTGAQK